MRIQENEKRIGKPRAVLELACSYDEGKQERFIILVSSLPILFALLTVTYLCCPGQLWASFNVGLTSRICHVDLLAKTSQEINVEVCIYAEIHYEVQIICNDKPHEFPTKIIIIRLMRKSLQFLRRITGLFFLEIRQEEFMLL